MTSYVISIFDIELLKRLLSSRLPSARASARVQALARGLGYETYASLRVDLASGRKRVEVDDNAFVKYLTTHGMVSVPPGLLNSALTKLKEVEDVVTGEMLSSMPDTLDEFLDWMEAAEAPPYVADWATAFGATEECSCGTTVIQPDQFAEDVLKYYKADGSRIENARDRIIGALVHSGEEVGANALGGPLCAQHAGQAPKND